MKPIYETETIYTLQEYKEMTQVLNYKDGHLRRIVFLIELAITCLGVLLAMNRHVVPAVACAIFVFIFPLILMLRMSKVVQKSWNSNPAMQDLKMKVFFYEDHLEQSSPISSVRFDYDQLYRVYETKTRFYIMPAMNQGIAVRKDACSSELITFLQELAKKHAK